MCLLLWDLLETNLKIKLYVVICSDAVKVERKVAFCRAVEALWLFVEKTGWGARSRWDAKHDALRKTK